MNVTEENIAKAICASLESLDLVVLPKKLTEAFYDSLEAFGLTVVPKEPTEEMMEAFYDGADAARDAFFDQVRRLNAGREAEGKRPFPYGIAPVEWFPAAYQAMLAVARKTP